MLIIINPNGYNIQNVRYVIINRKEYILYYMK